jgi:hypothetical protein
MQDKKPAAQPAAATAATEAPAPVSDPDTRPPVQRPSNGVLFTFVVLVGLMLALPVLVVVGSFPSGLISAFIIFIGMRQAWKMTTAPVLRIAGPYRVGASQAAAS